VRQGEKLSIVLYKRYYNTILQALERSNLGATIGNINVVAPTCADDIAILASKEHEAQALLDIVHDLTNRDIVTIKPLKSDLVPLTRINREFSVKVGKNQITQKTETIHLDLMRNNKNKVNIEDRLKIARRTVYAHLGPGLHARKRMSSIVSAKLWQTYVIPRNLYGIEVLNYTKTDILKFERLQFKYAAKYRVRKAEVKAKLITRTTLQSDKAIFTIIQENEICHSDIEDTEHFLLICPSLKSVRDRHLSVLRKYVANNF
jgi:hypothetical protein